LIHEGEIWNGWIVNKRERSTSSRERGEEAQTSEL